MNTHSGKTGQVLEITLPSQISRCRWLTPKACVGGKIRWEVRTEFVADDSEISILIYNQQGSLLHTLKGKVFANIHRSSCQFEQESVTGLYFVAKLPAHDLSKQSEMMQILPAIQFSKVEIQNQDGESLLELEENQTVSLFSQIQGPAEGTLVLLKLSLKAEQKRLRTLYSRRIPLRSGIAKAMWHCQFDPEIFVQKNQRQLDPSAESYRPSEVVLSAVCFGIEGTSSPVVLKNWVEVDFGAKRGQIGMQLPDGKKPVQTVPDEGVLRVETKGTGKVEIQPVDEKP